MVDKISLLLTIVGVFMIGKPAVYQPLSFALSRSRQAGIIERRRLAQRWATIGWLLTVLALALQLGDIAMSLLASLT